MATCTSDNWNFGSETWGTCRVHGGKIMDSPWSYVCPTDLVLADVEQERRRQFRQYGTNAQLVDGTGPEVAWLDGVVAWSNATDLESALRTVYEQYESEHGLPTWRHLVLEEVAEAFKESDPVRLREELVQVAALCVSWIEKLDSRVVSPRSEVSGVTFLCQTHRRRLSEWDAEMCKWRCPVDDCDAFVRPDEAGWPSEESTP